MVQIYDKKRKEQNVLSVRQYEEPRYIPSERDTEAESQGVDTVERIGQKIALVGRITVVECRMEAEAHVGSWEDRDTHLGLQVKAPGILILLIDVVVGADLGKRSTEL